MPRKQRPIAFRVDDRGCHICTSHSTRGGYPSFQRIVNGCQTNLTLHRFIFQQANGSIPAGMVVRHSCDNTLCINVDHLLLGTRLDNVRDCISRGRNTIGNKNGSAKATAELVIVIRKEHATGGVSYAELSRRHGLSACSISDIVNRKYWKHV